MDAPGWQGSYLCRRYRTHVGKSHMAVQMEVSPNAATVGKLAWRASKCVLADVCRNIQDAMNDLEDRD